MGGNRSRDVREDFAVKKGHNFFGSHGMRCGIHARPPFCAAALGEATCDPRCEVAVLAADTEGSSKSRSAVRARKRRDLTLFHCSSRRAALSAEPSTENARHIT